MCQFLRNFLSMWPSYKTNNENLYPTTCNNILINPDDDKPISATWQARLTCNKCRNMDSLFLHSCSAGKKKSNIAISLTKLRTLLLSPLKSFFQYSLKPVFTVSDFLELGDCWVCGYLTLFTARCFEQTDTVISKTWSIRRAKPSGPAAEEMCIFPESRDCCLNLIPIC